MRRGRALDTTADSAQDLSERRQYWMFLIQSRI